MSSRNRARPTEQAVKCLYLVTRSLDQRGQTKAWWTQRWKPALNAFAITSAERWARVEAY